MRSFASGLKTSAAGNGGIYEMASLAVAPTEESLSLLKRIEELLAENRLLWKALEQQSRDIANHGQRLKTLEARPTAAPTTVKIHERKLRRAETILLSHDNSPMSFSNMGKMLGYKKETRRQQMTKLGAAFKLYPDRYEVRDSKLSGKTVRLVPAYLNHLRKEGV